VPCSHTELPAVCTQNLFRDCCSPFSLPLLVSGWLATRRAARQDSTVTSFSTTRRRSTLSSSARKLAATLTSIVLVAAGLTVLEASPASAVATATVKATTQRMTEPRLASTQVGTYAANTTVTLVCHLRGQAVKGYYSPFLPNGGWDDLWYLVQDGYFVADVDIDTGNNNPVVAQCPLDFTSAPTPSVNGNARVGSTITAATGNWSPKPNLSYQWNVNGTAAAGATGASWTVPATAAGRAISVTVTASQIGYKTTQRTSPTVTAATGVLASKKPSVTGTPSPGSTLSAKVAAWGPAPVSLKYEWLRNGTAISGQTKSTHVVTSGDVGKALSLRVTGSKPGYTTQWTTSASLTIGKALTKKPAPTISGTGRVGSTLTVATGTWAPAPVTLTRQWYRNNSAITGASAAKYVLKPADAGTSITVRVTGAKTGYTPVTTKSAGKAIEGQLKAKSPTIAGAPTVGQNLTAKPGTWAPAPVTLKYKWLRNGFAISKATGAVYRLTSADAGKQVAVAITGTKRGYTTVSLKSTAVNVGYALTATPTPTITGTAKQGQKLYAKPGTWAPAPIALSYQWYRGKVAIIGAKSASYVVIGTDVAQAISVRVTGTKTKYTTVARWSKPVTPIGLAIVPATPSISGDARAGITLTAVPGSWSPSPLSYAYQWNVNGSPLGGATGPTWAVPVWAADKTVSVTVTGSRNGYPSATRTSGDVRISNVVGSSVGPGNSMPPNTLLRSTNGTYTFVVQGDGNLVVYRDGAATWASDTAGQSIREFAIQGDGNLVAYNNGGSPFWSSSTGGKSISALVMQDDGNLVLYDGSGVATWATSGVGGSGSGVNGWSYPIKPHSRLTTYSGHNGDDFPVGVGTPVYSMGAGPVSFNSYGINSSWCPVSAAWGGQQTDLRVSTNRDGHTYLITYAHLNSYVVSSGQNVQAGQLIGYSGQKGCADGAHLHVDIKVDGRANVLYPRNIFGTSY